MQLGSKQYPQIDWEQLFYHFDMINSKSEGMNPVKEKLVRTKLELCFTKATSSDDGKDLTGALQRSELFEVILRMSITWM